MKMLIPILLSALVASCASAYQPVYDSGGGGYYLAERASYGPYLGSRSMTLTHIGLYPWWVNGYPPQTFAYYSPYFYPHYFSVWYPPGYYYPYDGYYREHYAFTRQLYWNSRHQRHRGLMDGREAAQIMSVTSHSVPIYARSRAQSPVPALHRSSIHSTGFSRASISPVAVSRSTNISSRPLALDKH
jgi:hypothetical protein